MISSPVAKMINTILSPLICLCLIPGWTPRFPGIPQPTLPEMWSPTLGARRTLVFLVYIRCARHGGPDAVPAAYSDVAILLLARVRGCRIRQRIRTILDSARDAATTPITVAQSRGSTHPHTNTYINIKVVVSEPCRKCA